ncbi:RlmE family RNA methyltransferase [Desulfohalovibrio reitneri]|uniref:RlmE family RNA methyltransferase n=1 Tax=Desulfohalovibrio reitneri TaxID=1307759 RepID=UPI0004A77AA9|nr:RlmE family RNA methyltransferase [Desulfohalovibrio reitneri]
MKKYRDHYFQQAKRDNYPARSVYKLQEINKRFKVLSKGMRVLDLGAAPGSWSLYAAKVVGPEGKVLAVDLTEADTGFPDNTRFIQADAFEPGEEMRAAMEEIGPFGAVISDMAPKTTGHKFTDQARSHNLCEQALALAEEVLIGGGNFVAKNFEGPDTKGFVDSLRSRFKTVKTFKPKSSRGESKEIFVVGLGYSGGK